MKDKLIAKLKTPQGTAFISAFICGIAVHLFSMMNILQNHDSMGNIPSGFGASITSGRWALDILGRFANRFWGIYNMPSVNGFKFVLFVAFAAALAVTVLKLRRHISSVLCGALLAVFPSTVSTLFYSFTPQFYGFAILLAVFSAWILVKPFSVPCHLSNKLSFIRNPIYRVLISSGTMAVSVGIYQAYFPLAASLLVLSLIGDCLRSEGSFIVILRRAFYYLISLALGMAAYFIILQIYLSIGDYQLSSYKGIDNIGHISLSTLPMLLKMTRVAFVGLLHNNVYGLAPIHSVNTVYKILGLLSAVSIISICVFLFKRRMQKAFQICLILLLLGVLCLIFPYSVGLIRIMCPFSENTYIPLDNIILGDICTLMVYSYVVVGFAPAVIMEALPESSGKPLTIINAALRKGSVLMLAMLIALYAYFDEVNYTAAYYATAQMDNYTTALITQVRMTEGFDTEKQWVFIDDPSDSLLNNVWSTAPLFNLTPTYLQSSYT